MYDFARIANDPAELTRTAALLATAFPTDPRFTLDYLDWMYFRNPVGHAVGWNALSDGELAAHYVTLPIEARLCGEVQRGLLSLNTATHPKHQGQKLFTRLAEKSYQSAADEGYRFVLGVANANSTPGFLRKLGFDLICPLAAKIGVGAIDDSDEEGLAFSTIWSDAALQWRVERPNFHYTLRARRGGFRLFAPTGKWGVKALMFRGASDRTPPRCDGKMRAPATLFLGVDPKLRWSGGVYVDVPKRFRPSPLNLILKSLTGERYPVTKDTARIQALDFDAY